MPTNDLRELARHLASVTEGERSRTLAWQAIREGSGAALFKAVFSAFVSDEGDRGAAVRPMMVFLEQLMDSAPGVATYLMARLRDPADHYRFHAVYDGIELWIGSSASGQAVTALRLLAGEGIRRRDRIQIEAWATQISIRLARIPITGTPDK